MIPQASASRIRWGLLGQRGERIGTYILDWPERRAKVKDRGLVKSRRNQEKPYPSTFV